MTEILVIQASSRCKKANTDVMPQEFLKGAASAGAQIETIYLKDLLLKIGEMFNRTR